MNADANAEGENDSERITDLVECEKCPPWKRDLYIRDVCGKSIGWGFDVSSEGYVEASGRRRDCIAEDLSMK